MALLETKHILKKFGGVTAVDQVNAIFEGGKITALVGPNGSGKTTLINSITGLLPMNGGVVLVGDIELTKVAAPQIATYGITRTFQSVRVIEQMTVLDNILLVLTERNVWGALFEQHTMLHLEAAETALKRVGLWEKRHENAEKLSYGQRKILEIARAVSMRASIYFFDEPYAGLFAKMRDTVSEILEELRASGAAVILVEHNMDVIRTLADYCYVLDTGKVIAEGSPEKVFDEKVVIDAYLGK